MKKLDLGQTITILANIGVIAGIVFLGVELQQNNELMEAASRDAQNERIQDYAMQLYTVPGLAETLVKSERGETLTEAEELKLFARKLRLLRGFEAQYREFEQGTVESINLSNWKTNFYDGAHRNPPLYDVWDEIKPLMLPEFVEYFDENVANR